MGRKSGIWLREQDGHYYTTIAGERIKLSQNKGEAETLFHQEMCARADRQGAPGVRLTMARVADLFLADAQEGKEPRTFQNQRYYLQSFVDSVGKRVKAHELKVNMVTRWLAGHDWNETTRSSARAALSACLNWAVREEHLDRNPLAGKLPRAHYARRQRILTREERERIRAAVKGSLRDFLYALEQTGARPFSEVARITAEMINWREGSIPFPKHKTRRHGKQRTVYLSQGMKELLTRLAEQHPEGPLFRTRSGRPWTKGAVAKRLTRLAEKLGIPGLTAYAWRHTYISDGLSKGLSDSVVAELVGSSPRTIHRYYSHLDSYKDMLREAARKAVSE
jgi:integrase